DPHGVAVGEVLPRDPRLHAAVGFTAQAVRVPGHLPQPGQLLLLGAIAVLPPVAGLETGQQVIAEGAGIRSEAAGLLTDGGFSRVEVELRGGRLIEEGTVVARDEHRSGMR